MALDMNSPEFAKQLDQVIRDIVRSEFKQLIASELKAEAVGKVAASSSGATVNVYINESTTAVKVKNPRGFNLTTGQLVAVRFPKFKNDNSKFVDRIL
jgi:hypothetical protein